MQPAATTTPQVFPWIRYWSSSEIPPPLDGSFLDTERAKNQGVRSSAHELQRLEDLEEVPCLILIGPPGMGKSRELTNECERLVGIEAPQVPVLSVDLKHHGPDLFREAVFDDEKFRDWRDGKSELILFLDSLDECWAQIRDLIPTLVLKLKAGLQKPGHPLLKLRLGCRAAEWRDDATAKLEELFRKPENEVSSRVQIYQLAPLTRDDVVLAARASGLAHPAKFMEELATHDLDALAAHPLTLDLLLAEAKEGRALGPTRLETYRRGTLRLSHDPHEQTGAMSRNLHTTRESRCKIAGRLAAHGVLSRSYLYRLPNSAAPPETGVLAPEDFIPIAEDGRVDLEGALSADALLETYRCGLFRGAGRDCVTWQHQAYAEFLAAEFLAARKPVRNESLTQTLLGLVSDVGVVAPRIYPPLEELALWLIEFHPALFDRLLPGNADVLIRCHPGVLTDERRRKVVDLYFEQVRRHEAETQVGQITLPLGRLKHAMLPDQLRLVLLDRAESASLRRIAINIAEACDCHELVENLIALIFREGEDVRVVHSAAWLLRRWAKRESGSPEFARSLRESLVAAPDRADFEVLGCILPIIWPECLSTEELLPFLNRRSPSNAITSYDRMLRSELIGRVRPDDSVIFLRWAAGLSPTRSHSSKERKTEFIQQVVRLAFSQADARSELVPALVRLAVSWSHYDRPSILSMNDNQPLPLEVRRRFWGALLAESNTEKFGDTISRLTEPRGVFFVHEDLGWAVNEAVRAQGTARAGRWENVVSWLTRWEEQADTETVWPLVVASESFASLARQKTSCQLVVCGEPNFGKTDFYRKQGADEQRQELAPIEERLSRALEMFAQGREDEFWWATDVLFFTEDDEGELHPPNGRSEQPIRLGLSVAFHARFGAVACGYLTATTAPSPAELLSDTALNGHVCVVRLVEYFAEYDFARLDSLSDEWWESWLAALLVYQSYAFDQDDAVWSRIIGVGRLRQPKAFHASLRLWLKTRDAIGIEGKAWFLEELLNDAVIREILREHALSADSFRSLSYTLGHILLKSGDASLESALAERMTQRRTEMTSCHPQVPLAAALLLSIGAERWAITVGEEMASDPVWARVVVQALVIPGDLATGWVSFLPPDLLARLWVTLHSVVPKSPWGHGKAAFITAEHEIWDLQNCLLNRLKAQSTPEAAAVLEKLIERRPEDADWLGRMLAHARRAVRREGWSPMEINQARRFLRESGPRSIRNLGDLCDAVMDSLERYQSDLRAQNRTIELWHRPRKGFPYYEPQEETELSECLVRHLQRDLSSLGVWGEREVEVRRRTATETGDKPDIVILGSNPTALTRPPRLYIEVKCAWNDEALSGMQEQLVDRYLRTADCGIYVLAYYKCATWDVPEDWRRDTSLHRFERENAEEQLEAELCRLQKMTDKRLEAFFLDASL